MKIDGLSNFLSNTLQTVSELNLKEGQIIMGKIISLALDEAVLEIAGRTLQAKVEGNPPAATGQVATFQVSKDEIGRILLKFVTNDGSVNLGGTASANNTGATGNINNTNVVAQKSQETNVKAPDPAVLKNIQAALLREGIAPDPENINKIWRNMQDFQAKYQQPVKPEVMAFIAAKKWPVTPGTILASMVFQDKETREFLWNLLRKSLPEKEFTELMRKYALTPQAGSESIAAKMAAFRDVKSFQDLLGQLFRLATAESQEENQELPVRSSKNDPKNIPGQAEHNAKLKTGFKMIPETNAQAPRNFPGIVRPEAKQGGLTNKAELVLPSRGQAGDSAELNKSNGLIESKTLGMSGKLGRAEQQKIAAVLEQHITLSKSVPTNDPSGANYAIPFLINDPKAGLREFLVKWREENRCKNENTGQLIFVSIPTANLGDINLSLRVTATSTGIKLKVDNHEIRQYLVNHLAELKEAIVNSGNDSRHNPSIVIGLKDSDNTTGTVKGFDLWM